MQYIKEVEEVEEIEPLTWKFWKKRRYVLVLIAFFGFINVYALRVNLSVAIVAMTQNRTVQYDNGTIGYEQTFNWSSAERGIILSSFYYGYIITMFPAGIIGAKFGGSLTYSLGILATAILTILTPIFSHFGVHAIVILRVLEGIFEGLVYPSMQVIWSKWAPPLERSRMNALAAGGAFVGTAIAMPISSTLAINFGWESIFYVFGTIACIWFIIWTIFIRAQPDNDRFISSDELQYIQNSLRWSDKEKHITFMQYPWKSIFTSAPVLGMCTVWFCENWGFYLLLTELPTFLSDALQFNLDSAGILSAIPYITVTCTLCIAGYLADLFQVKKWMTRTQVRKYFCSLSALGEAIFILSGALIMNQIGTVVCIIIAVGIGGISYSCVSVNPLDLTPKFPSVLFGIGNTFGTLPGIIGPLLTGHIVQMKTQDEWKIVFYITTGVYLLGGLVYYLFGSGESQKWAKINDN